MNTLGEFLRRSEQLDALVRMDGSVVCGRGQTKHRSGHLVNVCRAVADGGIRAVDSSGAAGTRLEALTEAECKVGVTRLGGVAVAE